MYVRVCSVAVAFIVTVAVVVAVVTGVVILCVLSLLEKSILENLCADCAQVLNFEFVPFYLAAPHTSSIYPSLSASLALAFIEVRILDARMLPTVSAKLSSVCLIQSPRLNTFSSTLSVVNHFIFSSPPKESEEKKNRIAVTRTLLLLLLLLPLLPPPWPLTLSLLASQHKSNEDTSEHGTTANAVRSYRSECPYVCVCVRSRVYACVFRTGVAQQSQLKMENCS